MVGKDRETPEALEDKVLDDAQGGYSVELTSATIAGMTTEQLPRSSSDGIIAVELDAFVDRRLRVGGAGAEE